MVDDGFGTSVDAYNGTVVVGSPNDYSEMGSVNIFVNEARAGMKKQGIPEGNSFGAEVSLNKEYILVVDGAGESPSCVYIYSSRAPYPMKARLPYTADEEVVNAVIGEDNTVVVALVAAVHVYRYDGKATWHKETKLTFGMEDIPTIAISGDFVSVGLPDKRQGRGRVCMYRRGKGTWHLTQTIKPPKEQQFGENLALNNGQLAVSSTTHTFLYKLDKSTNSWSQDGNSLAGITGHMAIQHNILAVTSNDPRVNTVVSNLYKRVVDKHGKVSWFIRGSLGGDKLKADQKNWRVRIDGKLVYTSRIDESGEDRGVLYVHELT